MVVRHRGPSSWCLRLQATCLRLQAKSLSDMSQCKWIVHGARQESVKGKAGRQESVKGKAGKPRVSVKGKAQGRQESVKGKAGKAGERQKARQGVRGTGSRLDFYSPHISPRIETHFNHSEFALQCGFGLPCAQFGLPCIFRLRIAASARSCKLSVTHGHD